MRQHISNPEVLRAIPEEPELLQVLHIRKCQAPKKSAANHFLPTGISVTVPFSKAALVKNITERNLVSLTTTRGIQVCTGMEKISTKSGYLFEESSKQGILFLLGQEILP